MNDIRELMQEVAAFSTERDWDQFHSPENLAKSIAIEAAELLGISNQIRFTFDYSVDN